MVQTKPDLPPEVLAKQALEQQADIVIASGMDGRTNKLRHLHCTCGVIVIAMPGNAVTRPQHERQDNSDVLRSLLLV